MNLELSPAETAFRDELRGFVAANLKDEWRAVGEIGTRIDQAVVGAWLKLLGDHGYLTAGWPASQGGRPAWTPMQQHIFKSEMAIARAPSVPTMEFGMVAPLITLFGSEQQRARFLPRILSREDRWAQGFSEPNSGSDLASLRTTARREGDHYVVNGQKIWTSFAHIATMLFCLVRTDPKAARPQAGISMLFVPARSPGITIRPIRSIDGAQHLNEVFFDNVRVPADLLLGEENKGWDYARALLAIERTGIAGVQLSAAMLAQVEAIAAGDARMEDRVAALEIALDALEMLELRALDADCRGTGAGYEASLLKIAGSELRQDVLMLGLDALGEFAPVLPGEAAPLHPSGEGEHMVTDSLFYRAASIYGGANEVQRNIVAKALLRGNAGV